MKRPQAILNPNRPRPWRIIPFYLNSGITLGREKGRTEGMEHCYTAGMHQKTVRAGRGIAKQALYGFPGLGESFRPNSPRQALSSPS